MGVKEMKEQRAKLMAQAKSALANGNVDEANKLAGEIKALDAKIEAAVTAEKNLEALTQEPELVNLAAAGAVPAAIALTADTAAVSLTAEANAQLADDEKTYLSAWCNWMLGNPLSAAEQKAFDLKNDAHTTSNTAAVIPTTTVNGIWTAAAKMYPYWGDVSKTFVKGDLKIVKGATSSAAAWYDEATSTAEGSETFETITLTGCELARDITITYQLKAMAMADFLPYIERKMAQAMGAALGYGSTRGRGKPGNGDTFKAEPLGVITKLKAETGTPQIVEYSSVDDISFAKIAAVRAKITEGTSAGVAIYATSPTIWTRLATLCDTIGRPLFIPDVTAGGVGRILGLVVKEDASLLDGQILISNAGEGYHANVNQDMTMDSEDHKKQRTTDYIAYAVVDGAPIDTKYHALLDRINNTATLSATSFDKNSSGTGYVDITATLNPTALTASKLFKGATEIAKGSNGANWSVTNNVMTIKKEWLDDQTVGTLSLTIRPDKGEDISISITITDTST